VKRQIILLGRLGTVIVAVGLALLLVSLIPPSGVMSFGSGGQLAPETFRPLGPMPFGNPSSNETFYFEYLTSLTPQQELKVNLTCNGTINVYLLNINSNTLFQALNSNSTENQSQNVTLIEDYLNANPDVIAWEKQLSEGTVDYTPTTIINATLILSNPTQNTITVNYDGKILSIFVPAAKAQLLAFGAIPVGLILALPWLINLRKHKNHSAPP
jgi:hypothetical protein